MKNNTNVAKVNKEIGGWDYKGFHIDRNKELKVLTIVIAGDELTAKTLGEAKELIDEQVEFSDQEAQKATEVLNQMAETIVETLEPSEEIINFTSKKGTPYLLKITGGKIRAFTYEGGSIEPKGKKMYWSVTQEMRKFVAGLATV